VRGVSGVDALDGDERRLDLGFAVASAWEALMPGEVEGADSPLTGEPRTLIRRPSLATFAFTPLPNSGMPEAYCTQLKWCVPPMST
jgi:hypothetical protein